MKMSSGLVLVVTGLLLVAAMIGSSRANPATISIDPASVSALGVGETFTVDVRIADVTDLYGWQFNITFNSGVLGVESVAEGSFLASVNETMGLQRSIDNNAGYVLASSSFKPPYESIPDGASGSGQLASVTFSVKASGGSDLRFDEERTYLRTFISPPGSVQPIGDVVRQGGAYGGGGGGSGFVGVPWEIIGAAVAVVVVVAVVGVFLLRRRRAEAEGEGEVIR
jgi:hypothetical protein